MDLQLPGDRTQRRTVSRCLLNHLPPSLLAWGWLPRSVFCTLLEVKMLTEQFLQTYNRIRSHRSLGDRPPALETTLVLDPVPRLAGST